jgi:hypothetical protein
MAGMAVKDLAAESDRIYGAAIQATQQPLDLRLRASCVNSSKRSTKPSGTFGMSSVDLLRRRRVSAFSLSRDGRRSPGKANCLDCS